MLQSSLFERECTVFCGKSLNNLCGLGGFWCVRLQIVQRVLEEDTESLMVAESVQTPKASSKGPSKRLVVERWVCCVVHRILHLMVGGSHWLLVCDESRLSWLLFKQTTGASQFHGV